MQLLQVATHDMGALGDRTLDLQLEPDGLLGLVGENGTGKTTLLELSCPGALFRTLPSRDPGGLIELAKSREAFLNVTYEHDGHVYRLHHLLDGEKRKAEAHIYCDGAPYTDGELVSNGKLRTFDRLVAGLWPSWNLIAISRFWCQHAVGAWANVGATDRRDLLRELLGLHRMQAVADRAADDWKKVKFRRDENASHIDAHDVALENRQEALADHAAASAVLSELGIVLDSLKREENTTIEQIDACRAAAAGSAAMEKLERWRRLVNEADECAIDAKRLDHAVVVTRDAAIVARAAATTARQHAIAASVATSRYKGRVERVAAVQRKLGDAMSTVAGRARPDLQALRSEWKDQNRETERLAGCVNVDNEIGAKIVNEQAGEKRDTRSASLLGEVPCRGEGEYAGCQLLGDAKAAADRVPTYKPQVERYRAQQSGVTPAEYQTARNLLNALSEKGKDAARIDMCWKRVDEHESELVDAQVELGEAPGPEPDTFAVEQRLRLANDLAAKTAAQFAVAESTLGRLNAEIGTLPSEEDLLSQLGRSPDWDGPALGVLEENLRVLKKGIRTAGDRSYEERHKLGIATRTIEETEGVEQELDETTALERELNDRLERLARIRHAFGPKGMQAVLIDAAGPAVSEVATTLLEHAYGWPRFRVEIHTTAEKRSGDGKRDIMEAVIYDAEVNHTGPLGNLSGGERDMVRAALALGIAAHHSQREGVAWGTAWADEAGAALTRDTATRWVAMLRQASVMLGVRQLLLVTHDEEVQRALDRVIPVEELTE